MPQNYGLGRGLSSLIPKKNISSSIFSGNSQKPSAQPASSADNNNSIQEININQIVPNPHQPRIAFDEEKLEGLAQSILNHGIIQPLIVSKTEKGYELIAGERRFQAAQKTGLKTVPVIVREAKEKEKLELAIVENVQRHDLNAIEEARAYQKLMDDYQMTQDEVALKMGKSRSVVANKIRLLNLPIEIQKAIIGGQITEGHAKAILALSNPEKQRALFDLILKNGMTVRQVEEKTKEVSVRAHKRAIDPQVKEVEEKLMGALGTKVKFQKTEKGGRIVIECFSQEEVNNLINKLSAGI
jgi:ParB family transcriptional regulator, chromosome partitioning protein